MISQRPNPLLDGNTLDEVQEALAAMPSVKDPVKILDKVRNKFRVAAREDAEAVTGWCLASARDLARKMQSIGDYAGALKALKLIHDIASQRKDDAIEV